MNIGVIIGFKADGSSEYVGQPAKLSEALGAFKTAGSDEEYVLVELYSTVSGLLKRRKFAQKTTAQDSSSDESSSTEPPEGSAPEGGNPAELTFEQMAQQLVAEPDLIPEDGFTSSGKPECAALKAAFDRDFSAAERDEIWAMVETLKES